MRKATIITDEPIIEIIAEMKLDTPGVLAMAEWVKRYRPDCVPEGGIHRVEDLLPHDRWEEWPDGRKVKYAVSAEEENAFRAPTDNEILCELAGRKCYDSFAEKGAKRTNAEYLASMWTGRGVPHRSTGYHAKMSFFFAHVSRRVSHELIRNYVGSDRDEEGSPSQESTRFTEHPGVYIAHPRFLESKKDLDQFTNECANNYTTYLNYVAQAEGLKGMERKRVYEAAASLLLMSCATSFIWTTNPMALMKFFGERCDEAADLEMQRFANKLKKVCLNRWPNLFPGVK